MLQVRSRMPMLQSVSGAITTHSPKLWAIMGMLWVSSWPHTWQTAVCSPSAVQVAALVTVHSP